MSRDFIEIYDNVIPSDNCKIIYDYIKLLETRSIVTKEKTSPIHVDHKSINFAYDYQLDGNSWVADNTLPAFKSCVDDYLQKYNILDQYQYLLYEFKAKIVVPGGGFHRWHFENSTRMVGSRKFVLQLYLNTIEHGGETEFLYLQKRVPAVEGRLIIFPAGFTHTHRGNPPLGQEKIILTTWGTVNQ